MNKDRESHITVLEGVLKKAHLATPVPEISDDLIESIVKARPRYPEKESTLELLSQYLLPSVAVSWSIAILSFALFLITPDDDVDDVLISEFETMDVGVFLSKGDL
jgi:hypothetical protein